MEIVVANIRNFQFECERSNGISVLPDYESVEQVSIFDYVIFVDYFGHFLWDFLDGRYTEYFLFDYVYCRQYVNTINFLNTKQHKSVNENITKHLKLYLFGVRSQSPWPTHHCLWVCWMFFFRFAPITGIEHIFIAWYWKSRIDFLYIWCVYHIQRPNPTSSNKYPIRMRSPNGQKSKTQQCHVTTRVCHTDTRYHTLI